MVGAIGFELSILLTTDQALIGHLYERKSLIVKEWSGRKDLNLRPPGPEPSI